MKKPPRLCEQYIKAAVNSKTCPSPVYDQNTCGSLIKEAVDAKKCASILGIQYNDYDDPRMKNLMVSLQNVINNIQQIVCSSKLRYYLVDSINNMKYDESVRSSDEFLGEMKQEINRIISRVDPSIGITDAQLAQLKDSLASLIYIIVTVSSVDGKISGRNVKNTFIRIINSFCLNYVPPERMGPRKMVMSVEQANEQNMMKAKKAIAKDDVVNVSSVLGEDGATTYITTTYGDGSQTTTTSSLSGDVKTDLSSGFRSISRFGATSSEKVSEMMSNMASNVSSAMSNMSSTVSSQIASMNSGTRSSMSTFGKSSGSMMFFFVLIIVAVAAYFLYKNKEKLKMPSLSRQISNFGRQIKAVRRM